MGLKMPVKWNVILLSIMLHITTKEELASLPTDKSRILKCDACNPRFQLILINIDI